MNRATKCRRYIAYYIDYHIITSHVDCGTQTDQKHKLYGPTGSGRARNFTTGKLVK